MSGEIVDVEETLESSGNSQWQQTDRVFTPSGNTVAELTPGYYTIQEVWGQIRLIHQPIEITGLLKTEGGNSGEIVNDIERFWEMEEQFRVYKMPFKRGIMLSGPPGTGKTCIIKLLLADVIERGGVALESNFRDIGELHKAIQHIRDIQPTVPIVVVFEDLRDGMFHSEFLNLLDGIVPIHKVIIVGTTNHPEEIPDVILNRPGRFDAHYRILPPGPELRKEFLKSFVHEADLENMDLDKWIEDTAGLSMGHLKEAVISVILLQKSYEETIDRLSNMRRGIGGEEEEEEEGMCGPDCTCGRG